MPIISRGEISGTDASGDVGDRQEEDGGEALQPSGSQPSQSTEGTGMQIGIPHCFLLILCVLCSCTCYFRSNFNDCE